MSELKKCPFCGSEKELFSMPREMFISNGVSKNVGWSCICAHCDAHVWGREQEDTEATWNARPIEDALQARIDELETAINTVIEMSYIDVDHYAKRLDSNRAFSSCFTGIREVLSKVNNE